MLSSYKGNFVAMNGDLACVGTKFSNKWVQFDTIQICMAQALIRQNIRKVNNVLFFTSPARKYIRKYVKTSIKLLA